MMEKSINTLKKIIPLFEIDVVDIITPYIFNEEKEANTSDTEETLDDKTLRELHLQQEAMEREMQVSQRVQAFVLEELNLGINDIEHHTVLIAKDMKTDKQTRA